MSFQLADAYPGTMPADFDAFCTLSAKLGQDPMRVQGPGGNTSIKDGNTLWIKASGTELADAERKPIFLAVDREAARAEALGAGDGTCQSAVLDTAAGLRPSIETTFHALIDWPVVAHTHSVATIVHAISDDGLVAARDKLAGLPIATVPYRKPGRPLTQAIADAISADTQVVLLGNHGLIIAGPTVADVAELTEEVERRLHMPVLHDLSPTALAPYGWTYLSNAALAIDSRLSSLGVSGSYYPDHVVFLGPGLPTKPADTSQAFLDVGKGLAVREGATPAQRAMANCVSDVLIRLPEDWTPNPIGSHAEAELLNWDAEKYRQALAAREAGSA